VAEEEQRAKAGQGGHLAGDDRAERADAPGRQGGPEPGNPQLKAARRP
jgi:hypothetical protein